MKRVREFIAASVILPLAFAAEIAACPLCRAQVRNGIYNREFLNNLLLLLLPIAIMTAVGLGLYHFDKISDRLKGRIK